MSGILEFYDDMEDWRGDWNTTLWNQSVSLASATTYLGNIDLPITSQAEGWAAISFLYQAALEVIDAIKEGTGQGLGRYYYDLITDGIMLAGEFPEADITWQNIVAAWADADTFGRLWTTLSIDFMRKEVWNEPVTSFMLSKGEPAG